MPKIIDLRSDTVTKPNPAMRQAMASAEVGDDVYGEDPTVNKLEARAAEIFNTRSRHLRPHRNHGQPDRHPPPHPTRPGGHLRVPRPHPRLGDEPMVAAFSGCQPRTVTGPRGLLTWNLIQTAIAPKIYYRAQTGLICLENTHNMAGGTVTPLPNLEAIWAGAQAANLPVHLDGARVFNAAAALNLLVAQITQGFSTVNFCLSKGLGAPVGSVLVGSRDHIREARIFRKALGGGMRQAGILAAAGLLALEHGPARLHEDHSNARLLAQAISEDPAVDIDLDAVQTNIVIFHLRDNADAAGFCTTLKETGVLASAIGPHAVRLVTHADVSRDDCKQAADLTLQQLANLTPVPA